MKNNNDSGLTARALRALRGWLARWWPRQPQPPAAAQAPEALPAPPLLQLPLTAYATVVIPALNEAARIAQVVAYALSDPATAEVIVIDDSSIDDTAGLARSAGAKVITSTMLGKGASMYDGAFAAGHGLVAYLDGDLAGLRPGIISDLCRPLWRGEADFVKARFNRSGGRVTELTAKPMLKVFFPELAHFAQPLGGIMAARRSLLQQLPFEDGYGVDIGLLIDAHRAGARLAEVGIGAIEHDSQPLGDLTAMANEVSRVIYARARAAGRLHVEQIDAMYESQRQAAASLEAILLRRGQRRRLLLLSLDETVTSGRFALELARITGQEAALAQVLGEPEDDNAVAYAAAQGERIAALFRFVHKRQFERVARALPLRPGVIEFVNRMRRSGFMVGVLSDGYFIAADTLRRRVFADFALAHTIQFDGDVCTGELRLNPAFLPPEGQVSPAIDKANALRHFRADSAGPALVECWAVGSGAGDLELLRCADKAFAVEPAARALRAEPGVGTILSFEELLALVPPPLAESAQRTAQAA